MTVDFIDTPEAQAETERVSLALHDLAHHVRHDPAEAREHAAAAERITEDLRALYRRIGEP